MAAPADCPAKTQVCPQRVDVGSSNASPPPQTSQTRRCTPKKAGIAIAIGLALLGLIAGIVVIVVMALAPKSPPRPPSSRPSPCSWRAFQQNLTESADQWRCNGSTPFGTSVLFGPFKISRNSSHPFYNRSGHPTCTLSIEAPRNKCVDTPSDWRDSEGTTCTNYNNYCTTTGGYRSTWYSLRKGTFANYSTNGVSATEACCACGGGSTRAGANLTGWSSWSGSGTGRFAHVWDCSDTAHAVARSPSWKFHSVHLWTQLDCHSSNPNLHPSTPYCVEPDASQSSWLSGLPGNYWSQLRTLLGDGAAPAPVQCRFEGGDQRVVGALYRCDGGFVEGRPFYESAGAETALVAPLVMTSDVHGDLWTSVPQSPASTPVPEQPTCPGATSDAKSGPPPGSPPGGARQWRRVARLWRRAGQHEHASVASFAKFSLQLMAVAAPPGLVAAAHTAALQEIGHARLCFALAGRFEAAAAAAPAPAMRVGPFPVPASLDVRGGIEQVAASTAREGAVGETVAALRAGVLHWQALRARDHPLKQGIVEALDVIRMEEAAHAALAWRTLQWALTTSCGDAAVLQGLEQALRPPVWEDGARPLSEAEDEDFPEGLGQMGAQQQRHVTKLVHREVIGVLHEALRQYAAREPCGGPGAGPRPQGVAHGPGAWGGGGWGDDTGPLLNTTTDVLPPRHSALVALGGTSVSEVADYLFCIVQYGSEDLCRPVAAGQR